MMEKTRDPTLNAPQTVQSSGRPRREHRSSPPATPSSAPASEAFALGRTTSRGRERAKNKKSGRRPFEFQTIVLVIALLVAVAAVVYVVWPRPAPRIDLTGGAERVAPARIADIPINGQRAFSFLQRICDLGPRISGSVGMKKQREILAEHFHRLGGKVEVQAWNQRHPVDGSAVEMANLIVRWHPDRHERILLCAHYDTRPYPDQDPNRRRRRDVFLGANDGASGVAALAELGYYMSDVKNVGVDFVLFDAEEFIFDASRDPYFLGSERFAHDLVATPPEHRYRYALLLDMVGDASLQIFQERNSLSWRDSAPLVFEIWRTARDLGVREFIDRPGHTVRDDHLALHEIAGIPSCDIIDFDYPKPSPRGGGAYWHTTMDTPDKCSGDSLAKVCWVVLEWLKRQ